MIARASAPIKASSRRSQYTNFSPYALADVIHGHRIVHADVSPQFKQPVDQHQGRGLADVVGAGFEGQPPNGNRLVS